MRTPAPRYEVTDEGERREEPGRPGRDVYVVPSAEGDRALTEGEPSEEQLEENADDLTELALSYALRQVRARSRERVPAKP
jgi:hypothetical protein